MPVQVSDIRTLQLYLKGVRKRAVHHANNVDQIVFALAGAIVWKKGPQHLEVHQAKGGGMGAALSVKLGRKWYAFSYNHGDKCIDMKEGSYQGQVLHKFTNATPVGHLTQIFEGLL